MDKKAFSPTGKTVRVSANTSAPSGVSVPEAGTNLGIQIRIYNSGAETVFLSFGTSASDAQSKAIIPTGTSRETIPLPPGIVEVLSFPLNSFFSGITATDLAYVYLTPGKGI